MTSKQFGFRANLSTELALIKLTDSLKQFIDNGLWAGAVFVDLTKAFDTINHSILYAKLESFGICGPALALLQSYLTNRTQVARYGSVLSSPITTNQGLPQGSILGPLLFLIYMNDLPSSLNFSECISYADDTMISTRDKDINTLLRKLYADVTNSVSWCKNNLLNVNPVKTKFMLFHSSQKRLQEPLNYTLTTTSLPHLILLLSLVLH